MANIKEAFEYASQNPTSDFAKNLGQLASSGSLNLEAQKYGIDLSPFQSKPEPEKKNLAEKVASFTGGEKIAQGLGQALAQKETAKGIEETQKMQIDIQTKLLQQIKQKKAAGEDVSRLEIALGYISNDIYNTGQGAEKLLNPNELTSKQVIGDALQLATTAGASSLIGGTSAGKTLGVTQGATKGVSGFIPQGVGLAKGALSGAATGAISGIPLGASTGVSQALKEDKTSQEILKSGISGAVTGAVTGGVLGGVTGSISGRRKSIKLKKENFAEDLVSPKATTAVKEQALKEGRVIEPGVFSKSKIIPGKRDKDLADAVRPYVSNKKPITENIDSVTQGVRDINDGVKTYVKDNKVPFNGNQLRKQLNSGKEELNLIFASDANAEKTYNSVVDEFMKHVKSKDTAGLLDARQSFDKIPAIKKLLDSQGLGENAKKEIVLTARSQANRYIASLLPKGNTYRAQLLQESKMIEALGNMAEKNTGMIGQNKLQMLSKEYPVLKWIIGAAGTGTVAAGTIGAGGALIGSSD